MNGPAWSLSLCERALVARSIDHRHQSCVFGFAFTLRMQRFDVKFNQVWMHNSTIFARKSYGCRG
jgi:hypothetical protein